MRRVPAIADLIAGSLRDAGTRAIFGVPGGGGNLDLIDAARRLDLPFVLTSTETAAAIAAVAAAEVTRRPGACLTTLGPGAASVVNGVACAALERAPILVVTDSHPLDPGGAYTHQQIDQLAALSAVAKWSGRVTPSEGGRVIGDGFAALGTLPPGPVHIDCPADVRDVPSSAAPRAPDVPHRNELRFEPGRARRPLLLVGLGARRAEDADAIRSLCERARIPAMVTYKAKGVVPDDHPWFAGIFTNGAIERALVEESDLLIGVGFDPVELLPRPWPYRQPIVGFAPWRMDDRQVPFGSQMVMGIPGAMAMLEAALPPSDWDAKRIAAHLEHCRRAADIATDGLSAQRVVDVVAAAAGDCRVTVDAGAHMFPATIRWPVREPTDLLISNGLSTMGFALPAAIGAAYVDRRRVIALTGDGGLLMCAGELLTAARERLPVVTVVFNDASLSLIEIKQQARRLTPAGVALGTASWARVAEGFGVASFAADSEAALDRAVVGALRIDGPSLIDVTVDRSNYGAMMRAIRG
jgi:acetolactate synthase-1/2/3 large subunit